MIVYLGGGQFFEPSPLFVVNMTVGQAAGQAVLKTVGGIVGFVTSSFEASSFEASSPPGAVGVDERVRIFIEQLAANDQHDLFLFRPVFLPEIVIAQI